MFIKNCSERLKPSEEILKNSKPDHPETKNLVREEARKITLCLKTLNEYIAETDNNYSSERALPPHDR